MTLFLKDEDVAECVTMDAMLEAIESMQRHYGNGQAHNMTRRKIIAESGMLSVMGGGLFHHDGHPAQAGQAGRPQPSFASDQLVCPFSIAGADQERLKDAMLANALR